MPAPEPQPPYVARAMAILFALMVVAAAAFQVRGEDAPGPAAGARLTPRAAPASPSAPPPGTRR